MLFFLIPGIDRLQSMLQYANSEMPITLVDVPVSSVKYRIPSDPARKTTEPYQVNSNTIATLHQTQPTLPLPLLQ